MWVLRGFWCLLKARARVFVHMHVGFKLCVRLFAYLLCTGVWILNDFMLVESTFVHRHVGFNDFMLVESTFVHRHVGFKMFYGQGAQLLCTGVWVLIG